MNNEIELDGGVKTEGLSGERLGFKPVPGGWFLSWGLGGDSRGFSLEIEVGAGSFGSGARIDDKTQIG